MADSALVDLTDGSTAQGTDIVYAVRDPSGTPLDRKISMANVLAYIVAQANTWTAGQTISGASLTLSGNQSAAAWTTSGIRIKGAAGTLTDTTSSGTVAEAYTNVLGGNTIAASSATTFTNYFSLFVTGPTAGSNVTLTNSWALGLSGALGIQGSSSVSGLSASATGGTLNFLNGGSLGASLAGGTFTAVAGMTLAQGSPVTWGTDVTLFRSASDSLALYRSTNAQTFEWYGTRAGSTDYHRGALKSAKTTLSGVSGATVTATSLIPDGALVVGVTTKVTTALGTGNGTSGYQVGDGTDADRWGQVAAVASGTTTDNTNATSTTVTLFTSENNVVITADGGNFDGTGVIDVCVFYLIAQAD